MGHYDECYEADERDNAKRHSRKLSNALQSFNELASIEDKEFILNIIENIKDYKGFFKILHK